MSYILTNDDKAFLSKLANKILELSINQDKLTQYADGLHDRVVDYFNIERYTKELHAIYNEINL